MPNNQIKKKDLLVTERDKVLNIEKALIENRVDLLICLGGDFSD